MLINKLALHTFLGSSNQPSEGHLKGSHLKHVSRLHTHTRVPPNRRPAHTRTFFSHASPPFSFFLLHPPPHPSHPWKKRASSGSQDNNCTFTLFGSAFLIGMASIFQGLHKPTLSFFSVSIFLCEYLSIFLPYSCSHVT